MYAFKISELPVKLNLEEGSVGTFEIKIKVKRLED